MTNRPVVEISQSGFKSSKDLKMMRMLKTYTVGTVIGPWKFDSAHCWYMSTGAFNNPELGSTKAILPLTKDIMKPISVIQTL